MQRLLKDESKSERSVMCEMLRQNVCRVCVLENENGVGARCYSAGKR